MHDLETGEIFYTQERLLAFQFHKNDVGFKLMDDIIKSCVRGIRLKRASGIRLVVSFTEPDRCNCAELPFK